MPVTVRALEGGGAVTALDARGGLALVGSQGSDVLAYRLKVGAVNDAMRAWQRQGQGQGQSAGVRGLGLW